MAQREQPPQPPPALPSYEDLSRLINEYVAEPVEQAIALLRAQAALIEAATAEYRRETAAIERRLLALAPQPTAGPLVRRMERIHPAASGAGEPDVADRGAVSGVSDRPCHERKRA